MDKVLLHVCCGPCSTHSISELKKEYSVVLFWSDSNIFPLEEYSRRLEEARKMSVLHDIPLIEDEYDHSAWRDFVLGLEEEPEGGERCKKCFEYNLDRAAMTAKELGIELFTTTLTISPHKNSETIFSIGKLLAERYGVMFLEKDFKKKDGFRQSTSLSQKYNLYRQNYCGCEFSMRKNIASPNE